MTNCGDCKGNTGITFPAPKTVYRIGTGNWSDTQWASSSGGSPTDADFPLAQDTCVFDANTTTGTHTVNAGYNIGSLSMSAVTSAITLATGSTAPTFYGNVTLDADVTLSGTGTITFAGQGTTQTITSAGRSFTQSITVNSPTGTVAIADALTTSGTFTLTQGALNIANQTLTCTIFNSDNANTRSIAFGATGKIAATGNNAAVVAMTTRTNFSYTGTSRIECSYSGGAGTRTLFPGVFGTTESNSLNYYITAGTDSVRLGGNTGTNAYLGVDFTGFSGTVSANLQPVVLYGDIVFSSGSTVLADSSIVSFAKSSGSQSITTNGKTLDFPITKSDAGTLTLADNLTMGSTRTFTLTQGTLALNDKTLTTGLFSSSNSSVREINFGSSGELRVLEGGPSFNAATGTNLTTSGTGTINMVNAAGKTFAGGGRTYPTLNQGGTSALAITGANTFADISNVADSYGDTQKYNQLTYTEQFDQGVWAKASVNVVSNASVAPNGTSTADLVYPTSSGTLRTVNQPLSGQVTGNFYTDSVRIKASGINYAYVYNVQGNSLLFVDLLTGSISNIGSNIENVSSSIDGGGWVTLVFSSTLLSGTNISMYIGPCDAPGSTQVTANGTDGILVWGAQIVTGPYPGVYQKVEDASTFTPQADAFPVAITFPSGVTTSVQDFSVGGTLGNLVTLNASTPGSRAILNRV